MPSSLGKNLLEADILWLTLAVYLGTVVQNFFSSLTTDLLSPVLFAAIGGESHKFTTFKVRIGSQELLLGDLATRLFELVVAIVLVVATVELIRVL